MTTDLSWVNDVLDPNNFSSSYGNANTSDYSGLGGGSSNSGAGGGSLDANPISDPGNLVQNVLSGYGQDAANNPVQFTNTGGGSSLNDILSSVLGTGSGGLGQFLQAILGATNAHTLKNQGQAMYNQAAQQADPWLNTRSTYIPQMQSMYANRANDPNFQARNQAIQTLSALANHPVNFSWFGGR